MKTSQVSLKTSGGSASKSAYDFRILFFENEEGWAAQCLEYDLATQAETLEALYYEVERILVAHIALADELGIEPFEGLDPAPQKYWDIFEKSQLSVERPGTAFSMKEKKAPSIRPRVRVAQRNAA